MTNGPGIWPRAGWADELIAVEGDSMTTPIGGHSEPPEVFSNDEVAQLIKGAIDASDQGSVSDAEVDQVIHWAIESRVGEVMLDLALEGRIGMLVRPDGEVTFKTLNS
jgi:hypothetical protein